MPRISQAGIYEMTDAEYHADPVTLPSLSSSIARTLLGCSPLHAQAEHPRLSPEHRREDSEQFDLGTAAHKFLLEGTTDFVIIDAPDWRTKGAREQRDEARTWGKLPILAHRWDDVQAMAGAAKAQLDAFEDLPRPLANGRPERTLIWQEGEVWCRARLDWLHEDNHTVDDLKTTAASASPDAWSKLLFAMGYDIQAAFYLRGLRAVLGVHDARFRFIVIENTWPYALSVLTLSPGALDLADRKVRRALEIWGACLNTGHFAGYPTRCCVVEPPAWEEARWVERELALTEQGVQA